MNRLDDVGRNALRGAAPDIIAAFRGRHNRKLSSRKELRWGNKGSLSLVTAGPKAGLWFDHELGRGGDIIDFIRLERGWSFIEAINYAGRFVSELCDRPAAAPRPPPRRQTADDDGDDEQRIEQALAIWCEARPLRGTPAETYLRSRYIEVPDAALQVLRFHPSCPWKGERRPALVALVCDAITDEPTGIHRTALSAGGGKIGRMALGLKADGAVKLSGDITAELTIAEGIETTLSAMMLGFGPAWSVIDAGGIAKFPVLPGIERLIIAVDNDPGGAGQKAAAECKARWTEARRYVRTVTPRRPGEDLNDVLMRQGRRWPESDIHEVLRERERA
jgi:putative DNA primase/helicase